MLFFIIGAFELFASLVVVEKEGERGKEAETRIRSGFPSFSQTSFLHTHL
jgi:hypothetical protein